MKKERMVQAIGVVVFLATVAVTLAAILYELNAA